MSINVAVRGGARRIAAARGAMITLVRRYLLPADVMLIAVRRLRPQSTACASSARRKRKSKVSALASSRVDAAVFPTLWTMCAKRTIPRRTRPSSRMVRELRRRPLCRSRSISLGVTVFVSNKAELHLLGSEMDYVDTDLRSEFVFTNPRAKGVCGCGESFHT